jgi:hypothetical protein
MALVWQGGPWLSHLMVDNIVWELLQELRSHSETGSQRAIEGSGKLFYNILL